MKKRQTKVRQKQAELLLFHDTSNWNHFNLSFYYVRENCFAINEEKKKLRKVTFSLSIIWRRVWTQLRLVDDSIIPKHAFETFVNYGLWFQSRKFYYFQRLKFSFCKHFLSDCSLVCLSLQQSLRKFYLLTTILRPSLENLPVIILKLIQIFQSLKKVTMINFFSKRKNQSKKT